MAKVAIGKGMPAGEGECGVVKVSRSPAWIGGVALVTCHRILCCHMIGIGGLVVVVLVTGNAFGGSTGIIPVNVT